MSTIGLEGSVFLKSGERIRGAGVGSEEEQPMGTAEHGIRTDDLEVTELQKASWEGKSKTDWKERRKRENLGQKNHTLDCPLHWTPKNTQLRCA